MRHSLRILALVVALGMVLMVSAAGAGASTHTKAKPAAWAKSVCTSVNTWLGKVEAASAKAIAAVPKKPKAAKQALVKVVDAALAATKQLVGGLKKVGAPSVARGAALASIVVDQYKQVQRTFAAARIAVSRASTKSAAGFVATVRPAEDALESALEHVQAAFNAATNLDVQPLVQAFNAEPSCKTIVAAV
jgi:hypothetical protein